MLMSLVLIVIPDNRQLVSTEYGKSFRNICVHVNTCKRHWQAHRENGTNKRGLMYMTSCIS